MGAGTALKGGLERENAADGLHKVTGVARSLEADEIGCEETT